MLRWLTNEQFNVQFIGSAWQWQLLRLERSNLSTSLLLDLWVPRGAVPKNGYELWCLAVSNNHIWQTGLQITFTLILGVVILSLCTRGSNSKEHFVFSHWSSDVDEKETTYKSRPAWKDIIATYTFDPFHPLPDIIAPFGGRNTEHVVLL